MVILEVRLYFFSIEITGELKANGSLSTVYRVSSLSIRCIEIVYPLTSVVTAERKINSKPKSKRVDGLFQGTADRTKLRSHNSAPLRFREFEVSLGYSMRPSQVNERKWPEDG